jgi:S1-C subfamily serine protease
VLCAQVSGDSHLTRPTLGSDSGVMVVARLANSDTKNELASGDVIQSVNGTKVTNVDTLRALIDKLDPGSAAVLRIERRKQFKYIAIEID